VLTPVAHGGDLVCVLCIALLDAQQWDLIETAPGQPTTLKQYENVDNLKGNEKKTSDEFRKRSDTNLAPDAI